MPPRRSALRRSNAPPPRRKTSTGNEGPAHRRLLRFWPSHPHLVEKVSALARVRVRLGSQLATRPFDSGSVRNAVIGWCLIHPFNRLTPSSRDELASFVSRANPVAAEGRRARIGSGPSPVWGRSFRRCAPRANGIPLTTATWLGRRQPRIRTHVEPWIAVGARGDDR